MFPGHCGIIFKLGNYKILKETDRREQKRKKIMGKTTNQKSRPTTLHVTMGGKSVARKSLPILAPEETVKTHVDKVLSAPTIKRGKTAAQRKRATDRDIAHAIRDSTDTVFPKEPFSRLVHRILRQRAGEINPRIEPKLQATALEIIQSVAEEHLVRFYRQLEVIARNQGHQTILRRHVKCFNELRKAAKIST